MKAPETIDSLSPESSPVRAARPCRSRPRGSIVNLSCAIIALCAVSSAFAQSDAQFAKANPEYAQGQFKEAIADYEALVRNGEWSANLFYDLGNAYFRTSDLGNAILNYERALALDPRHPEANANLALVRDEARALELQQSRPEHFLRFATTNQYAVAAAVAFWIGAFSIAALIYGRRWSIRVMTMSILSLSIFVFGVVAIGWLENGRNGRALAVVTESGVDARVATADTANTVLALPAGSEVNIVSQRGDWIYATLPNNLRGWVPAKSVTRVRL
jgi:tetratricopeptide repeat protein